MKKYISALLLMSMTLMPYTVKNLSFAEYTVINSEKTVEELAPGITYEHQVDFTNKGFININVLRMDYDDPYVEMDLLKSEESISNRATVSEFAKSSPTLYGGVNGDFFNYDYQTTIGPMVEDGVVYSSPINDPEFSSFNITKSNQFLIHNWAQTFFRLEKKGFKLPIDYVNKPYFDGNKVILFNTDWSTVTRGNKHPGDIIEMMVIDGVVREITLNGDPKIIPDNGYVIAAVGNKIDLIKNNFQLFDEVNFVKDDSFDAIDFSIGGGTRLLKDSAVVDAFTLGINGRHPRTAIAYTANREVLLVTVDGRSTSYPGVTQLELANILLALGATDAVNLDGGGSTAMVKRNLLTGANELINRPSDGGERRVQNAVGFKGSYPVTGLDHLKIEAVFPRVFVNDSIEIAIAGFDKSNNKLSHQNTDTGVEWQVLEGEGTFIGNTYFPTSAGTHKIMATINGAAGTTDIQVLKDIAELRIRPGELLLTPGDTVKLTADGISSDGYYAPIKADNITWLMTGNTGTLTESGVYTAYEESGSGIIRASFNDLETYVPIAVGTETRLIHDFETELGSFVSYPKEVTGKYSLLKFGQDDSLAGKLEFNFKNSEATRAAYIDFGGKLTLDSVPDKIALDVFGNYGNNHWLRAKLKAGDGKTYTVDFQQNVSWEGWKNVEALLPKNLPAPLSIERIYLVETDPLLKDAGTIVIDNLTGVFQPSFSGEVPQNTKKTASLGDFMLFGTANFIINTDSFNFETLTKENINNTTLLKINNRNNGIRKNDYTQWITLLNELKSSTNNPLLLVMSSSPDFIDPLEKDLFYESLEEASKTRKIAIAFPNTQHTYRVERGIELIGLNTADTNTSIEFILDNSISFGLKQME